MVAAVPGLGYAVIGSLDRRIHVIGYKMNITCV
jgi:hypothetical protein